MECYHSSGIHNHYFFFPSAIKKDQIMYRNMNGTRDPHVKLDPFFFLIYGNNKQKKEDMEI